MDLGPVAGRLRPFPSEYGADLPEADGRGDKRPGIDRCDGDVETRRGRQNAHRGDVLQSQRPGVDMAWAASQADIDGMARLTFTVGETGVLVTGEQSAVSAYTAQLGNLARMWGQPVTVSEVADVGAAAAVVTSFAASSGSYVQLSQRSMELLRQHQMIPGQTAKFFQGAVR